MEIAVARVKDVADSDAVTLGYFLDLPEHLRKLASRNDPVLGDYAGRQPSCGSDSLLAGDPEARPLLRSGRHSYFTRSVSQADLAHFCRSVLEYRFEYVHLGNSN